MSRCCTVKKNDAFLLIGPLDIAVENLRVVTRLYRSMNGLSELKAEELPFTMNWP